MATFDYARNQSTADRLIAKFGQVGAILRSAPGAGPANDPGPATITSYQATLAVLDYSNREVDGTRILAGDRRIYISAKGLAIEPKPGDVVVEANAARTWRVVNVQSVAPAGIVVFWDLQARA